MDYVTALVESSELAPGIVRFRLTRPVGFDFKAGQYFILNLGEGLAKPFSYSNSPTEGDCIEFTTRMSGSEYKRMLGALRAGENALVSGPLGSFTYGGQGRVVFLAGGIGVTPFRSMCKWLTDSKADCDVALMWGVSTIEEAVFKDDFDAMAAANPRLSVVYVVAKPPAGWKGCGGYVCRRYVEENVPWWRDAVYYVCGPPKMTEAMDGMLAEMGIPKERVVKEAFSGY